MHLSIDIDVRLRKESQDGVVTSGMDFLQKSLQTIAIAAFAAGTLASGIGAPVCAAQNPAPSQPPAIPAQPPSILDRLNAMMAGGKSAWTQGQLAQMERLRDAALKDPYALNELRHLSNNIGPRLSGSPQAAQAVQYVAAEMRALGAEVTLEKAKVPHWVRGAETGEVVAWPGQTPGTTQKVVLTALGGSVATPADGLTAEVVVVDDWKQLSALHCQGENPAVQSQVRQGNRR
jgi:hypothetical protein